jgi:hypothetical protein
MSAARSHRRTKVVRDVRAAKTGNAREAIGQLGPGCEVYVLTFGQFSLIDAMVAILEQTGPADVVMSTWTAAQADLRRSRELMRSAQIRSLRLMVDRSFLTRQPEYCASMRELFGDASIRTLRSHAKFLAIRNDRWNIAVRTSMNLNENPRLENIEISDDAGLCSFLWQVADDVFEEQPAGQFDGEFPTLGGVVNVATPHRVTMGQAVATTSPTVGPGNA